jgi:arginase family enzyme
MIKKISEKLQVVGMDIVELCPDYDLNQNTANHASRILMEMISSLRIINDKAANDLT